MFSRSIKGRCDCKTWQGEQLNEKYHNIWYLEFQTLGGITYIIRKKQPF